MIKVAGAILVILSSSAIGFQKSHVYGLNIKELEELRQIFMLFQVELTYGRQTMFEIFQKLTDLTDGIWKDWLKLLTCRLKQYQSGPFTEIWKRSVQEGLSESHLTKMELDWLEELGPRISYPECVEAYVKKLEWEIEKKRRDYEGKKKLYPTIGIMGGIFLSILLL